VGNAYGGEKLGPLLTAFAVTLEENVMQIIWVTLLYELVPSDKLGRVASVDWDHLVCCQLATFSLAGSVIDWVHQRFFCWQVA